MLDLCSFRLQRKPALAGQVSQRLRVGLRDQTLNGCSAGPILYWRIQNRKIWSKAGIGFEKKDVPRPSAIYIYVNIFPLRSLRTFQ